MLEWLRANILNILIIAAVAALVAAAIAYMIRSKKKGKSVMGCGGNCASCIYGSQCGGGTKDGTKDDIKPKNK